MASYALEPSPYLLAIISFSIGREGPTWRRVPRVLSPAVHVIEFQGIYVGGVAYQC